MAHPIQRQVQGAGRLARHLRRQAQRATTDLAEMIDNAMAGGAVLDEVAEWAGETPAAITQLLAAEKGRIYRRRYQRTRVDGIKGGTVEPYHGTAEGLRAGCRCGACNDRRARDVDRTRQARKSGLPPDDPRHGTYTGYNTYNCRCGACVSAASAHRDRDKDQQRWADYWDSLPPERRSQLRAADRLRKRDSRHQS